MSPTPQAKNKARHRCAIGRPAGVDMITMGFVGLPIKSRYCCWEFRAPTGCVPCTRGFSVPVGTSSVTEYNFKSCMAARSASTHPHTTRIYEDRSGTHRTNPAYQVTAPPLTETLQLPRGTNNGATALFVPKVRLDTATGACRLRQGAVQSAKQTIGLAHVVQRTTQAAAVVNPANNSTGGYLRSA